MRALRFTEPVRAGPREAGSGGDDDRRVAVEDGELPAVADPGLMDVTGEDELGARTGKAREHLAAASEGALARPPRRVRQLVVEAGHPERSGRRVLQRLLRVLERGVMQPTGLMSPRPHGVEADDKQLVGTIDGRRRLPFCFERVPRSREARRR